MSFPLQTDILLVGAGPIGIELAVALQRKGFDYVHVESGVVASTIAWYAPGTPIFSSPERIALAGIPFQTYPHGKATREDYLNYLRGVVLSEDLTIHQGQRLVTAQRSAEGFRCRIVESRTAVGGPSFRSLDEEHSGERPWYPAVALFSLLEICIIRVSWEWQERIGITFRTSCRTSMSYSANELSLSVPRTRQRRRLSV